MIIDPIKGKSLVIFLSDFWGSLLPLMFTYYQYA